MEHADKYADAEFIDLQNDYELAHWTSQLKVTNDQLKAAVEEVGNKIERVKVYLDKA